MLRVFSGFGQVLFRDFNLFLFGGEGLGFRLVMV